MKVLFLTNIPSPYRVSFFNELGKYCDLTVTFEGLISTERNTKWVGEESSSFHAIYMNGIRTGVDNFFCPQIVSIIKRKWDHIIIGVYATPTSILAIEYMRMHRIPFIFEADGGFIKNENKIKYLLKRHLISSADCWMSTADLTTSYLVHYGAKKEKCYKYPFSSLRLSDLTNADCHLGEDKVLLREKLGISERKVVISVGRFSYDKGYGKGYDILLYSFRKIPNEVGLYIIGDTPTPEFVQMKKNLGLDNIHFIGFKTKNELSEYYTAADLFILETRGDVWGLVINEAMAFSLPIITSDKCIAGTELVSNDVNGYVVPLDKVDQLPDTIMSIVNNEEKRNKFGSMSRKKIEGYTIENMAKVHIEFLTRVMKN